MTLVRNRNTNDFNEILAKLDYELASESKNNLLSQVVHAEEFYKRVLSVMFDWNLVNINEVSSTTEAIDLVDDDLKVIVQVSVSCTSEKINKTLAKSSISEWAKRGYALKFAFVGYQDRTIKAKNIKNPYEIKFLPKEDILLSEDLVGKFSHLDISMQEKVLRIARQETGSAFMLTEDQLTRELNRSKKALGSRYCPDVDISVPETKYHDVIFAPEHIKNEVRLLVEDAVFDLNRHGANGSGNECGLLSLSDNFIEEICEKITEILSDSEAITSQQVNELIEVINQALFSLGLREDKDDETIKINRILRGLSSRLLHLEYELIEKNYFVFTGPGGIGKSHYLANLCTRALEERIPAILSLGFEFTMASAPLEQIANRFEAASAEELLSEMQRLAQSWSGRALIVIDGINEGIGKEYWIGQITRLCSTLEKYPEITLVLSVRSPYEEHVLPEAFRLDSRECEIELEGFAFLPDALEAYCDYYELDPPVMPPLGEEFCNPLFLRLMCEATKSKGQPRFLSGLDFSEALRASISGINERLSKLPYLDYDCRINVASNVLKVITACDRFEKYGYVTYEEAVSAAKKGAESYVIRPAEMVRALVEENVLSTIETGDETFVRFVYERIGDYLVAERLLDEVELSGGGVLEGRQVLLNALQNDGRQGVSEAIAVLLPEKTGIEIFEIVDKETSSKVQICELFISSLFWRPSVSFTPEIDNYIKNTILVNSDLLIKFISACIARATILDSFPNANYLHGILKNLDSGVRDAVWSWGVLKSDRAEKMVLWLWEKVDSLPEEHIKLCELFLFWCLASTHRALRDSATKVLARCLLKHPQDAAYLFEEACCANDDYVLERCIAAIYGAAANLFDKNPFVSVASQIYGYVYENDQTYPHLLVRNYTDALIDCLILSGAIQKDAFPCIHKRGKSDWYPVLVSNEDIDLILNETKKQFGENSEEENNLWWIIRSMTTEYGRGIGAYGDFGRYELGSDVGLWANQFDSDQDLANLVLWEVLKKRYRPKLHCKFDRAIEHYDRHQNRGFERISKKYQWIELHRLMARLLDNYEPFIEQIEYDEEYCQYQRHQSAQLWAFINGEYGPIPNADYEDFKQLERLEPEMHIARRTKTLVEASEVFNSLLYLRDIDPTYLEIPQKNCTTIKDLVAVEHLVPLSGDSTFDGTTLAPIFAAIRGKSYNDRYTVLSTLLTRKHCSQRTSEVHLNMCSGFLKRSDFDAFRKDYLGVGGSDVLSQERHYVYAYEFGKSYVLQQDDTIRFNEQDAFEKLVIPASVEYFWESVTDYSLDGNSVSQIQPCQQLVDYFDLKQIKPGWWIDESGEVVSFCNCMDGEYEFLFDAERLNQFLEDSELILCQGSYFEISSPDECQRVWLLSKMECAEWQTYEINREQYKRDKTAWWYDG